jgi:hypothetical protein
MNAGRAFGSDRGCKMDGQLSASEWAKLPKEDRLAKCREYVLEAKRLARTAPGGIRGHYLAIAEYWRTLEIEIEAEC